MGKIIMMASLLAIQTLTAQPMDVYFGTYNKTGFPEGIYHYEINSKKGHKGFFKVNTIFTQLEDYIQNQKKTFCEKCGIEGVRLEVHHKNKDHADNDLLPHKILFYLL